MTVARAKLRRLASAISTNHPIWLSEDSISKGWHKWLVNLVSFMVPSNATIAPVLPEDYLLELAQLEQELEIAQMSDRSIRAKQWSSWAKLALEGAAGKAHKCCKEPSKWRPSVDTIEEGAVSAPPRVRLEGQKKLWGDLWRGDRGRSGAFVWPVFAKVPVLPPLSVGQLRKVSQLFSLKTASAPDGFHVRHFGLLCDQALAVLSKMLQIIELQGFRPSQASQLLIAMLEKPMGGFRPIGIFPGIYRLWMKARGPLCSQWEADHDLNCFAMGKQRGPVDVIWRQAVKSETSVGKGDAACEWLWDLVKFYESLCRHRLFIEAEAMNFPMAIIRLNIAGNTFPRFVALGGMVVNPTIPLRGVVAGCGAATTLVKLYYFRPFRDFTIRHPVADMDAFIDDVQLAGQGKPDKLVADMVEAAIDLRSVIEEVLGSEISVPKVALVSSNAEVSKRIRSALRDKAGLEVHTFKNLGIDCSAGRARPRDASKSTRHKRFNAIKPRVNRLKSLVKAGARRTGNIWSTGFKPQAAFGCEVHGLFNGELEKLQKADVACLHPFGMGKSRALMLLAHGDPLAKQAIAALHWWAVDVWKAANQNDPGLSPCPS
jgi:hypothetical protein